MTKWPLTASWMAIAYLAPLPVHAQAPAANDSPADQIIITGMHVGDDSLPEILDHGPER
ncbi:hypothetical protein [Sphingobium aromaticiconvertens]|uniref:hypothetical protein n=1 Tax=Sphingobium aromaticiconvertens TaxID=365341 RepID=UPI00301B31A8